MGRGRSSCSQRGRIDARRRWRSSWREDPGSAGRARSRSSMPPGAVAAHTGESCMPFAGDVQGDGVSCQANIMASERVWPAMLEAFDAARGALTARLLAALDAAEASRRRPARPPVGGDPRRARHRGPVGHRDLAAGRGPPRAAGRAGPAGPAPRAYGSPSEGDELVGEGRHDEASRAVRSGQRARARNPTSCASGPASVPPRPATWTRRWRTSGPRSTSTPGWLELLPRLSPECSAASACSPDVAETASTAGRLGIDQHAGVERAGRVERRLGRPQRGGERLRALAVIPGRWSRPDRVVVGDRAAARRSRVARPPA